MQTNPEYFALRAAGFDPSQAFAYAKVQRAWNDLDGETVDDYDKDDEPGTVRLVLEIDPFQYDDSYIDTWDDVSENEREQIRRDLWANIERDGVYTVVGQYWDGAGWGHASSCGGFIGDDWRNSGYDFDIMGAAIDAYNVTLETVARDLEATRPDMYGWRADR